MKKSLLIAPALGVLVLAAAGSVGGTVAWFTSNAAWDNKAGEFAITKLDGNLKATVTKGIGTEIKTGSEKDIVVAEDAAGASQNLLTHGSYDIASKKVFVKESGVYNAKTEAATGAGSWLAKGKGTNQVNNIFYAVSWNVTFTYDFPADKTAVNLYFDFNSSDGSTAAVKTPAPADGLNTYKGFRIAFVGDSEASTGGTVYSRVWAPNESDSDIAKMYVKQSSTTNVGEAANLTASDIICAATTKIDLGGIAVTNRSDCIGQFTTDTENVSTTLTFKFVAWFEGEDSNVFDNATLDTIPTVALKFYTRQNRVS